MEALQEQITELEKQNIEKKDWVLMGEATAKGRPQNSLLEEDLEFERIRKAVPLITEDAVKTLEEKIKARILENRYDDVVRMSAGSEKPFLPSKFFELQDTKSNQSLAQIYENDYMDSQGAGPGDDRDGKLKREHDEISGMWDKICGKLDALCNAHFVPKAVCDYVTSTPSVLIISIAQGYDFYAIKYGFGISRVCIAYDQICFDYARTRRGLCCGFGYPCCA